MKIFNTLTRQKEEFVPLEEGKVKMYVCGPTVYNLIHIGNARPMIIFDTVRRYMEYKGYEVNYVSNFTDVDDKIIKKAIERDLRRLFEEGVKWLVFSGNLGFEAWVLEVAFALKKDYDFQMATIFLFENVGENWNESNQELLARFKQVDFVKYAYPHYSNPGQLKEYNQFLIDNADGAYLFYDPENETNLKYLYKMMVEKEPFYVKQLSFDDLNELAENFYEN